MSSNFCTLIAKLKYTNDAREKEGILISVLMNFQIHIFPYAPVCANFPISTVDDYKKSRCTTKESFHFFLIVSSAIYYLRLQVKGRINAE